MTTDYNENQIRSQTKTIAMLAMALIILGLYHWRKVHDLNVENEKLWEEVLKFESKKTALDNMWEYEKARQELEDKAIQHGYEP